MKQNSLVKDRGFFISQQSWFCKSKHPFEDCFAFLKFNFTKKMGAYFKVD